MNLRNKVFIGVVSAALISSATFLEGNKPIPYEDIVGVLTVCRGYTGKDIIRNKVYTPQECDKFTATELNKHGQEMLQCVDVPLSQNEYNAYTLFAYNVGAPNFCSSQARKELNKGNHELACNRLSVGPNGEKVWSFAGGKYVEGLHKRRQYETKMCLGELNGSKD
jgi:lysozyme